MANPDQLPPSVMAEKFGIGKLRRHLFVCLGPDCVPREQGEKPWWARDYEDARRIRDRELFA